MTTKELLSEVLDDLLKASKTGVTRLSRLSGVPPKTLNHWLHGNVARPRRWQEVVKVASALHLTEAQTDRLLLAAGHARVRTLRATAGKDDLALLASFNDVSPPHPASAPFRAPPDLNTFVGREQEITTLRESLLREGQAVIHGVRGMAGVGKTMLATRLAYRTHDDFPDGVLWARLDVSDTLTILASFAHAYGKDVSQFRDVESRAAAVRDLLMYKRALVILDNAENSDQVKPLLPPSTSDCAVLVTTRVDLESTDGWPFLLLHGFEESRHESLALFEKFIGRPAATRQKDTLMRIADVLGHLPLALSIAAGQAAHAYKTGAIASETGYFNDMLAELKMEHARLDRLQRDKANVRASFNLSYRRLAPDMQRKFAALGVFGGADFSTDAVAAVWGAPAHETASGLQYLMAHSLIQPARESRYRLHPLLRDYALAQLAGMAGDESELRSIQFFAGLTQRHLKDFAMLDEDADNVIHALRMAHAQQPRMFVAFALSLYDYFETRGLFDLGSQFYAQCCEIAGQAGDNAVLARALFCRASLRLRLAEYETVIALSSQGLDAAQCVEDRRIRIDLNRVIGAAYYGRGDFRNATRYGREAVADARSVGDHQMAGRISCGLGMMLFELGEIDEGRAVLQAGLQEALSAGDIASASVACINLSEIEMELGNPATALTHAEEAVRLARSIGHRERLANALADLGHAKSALGQMQEAEAHFAESVKLAEPMSWMRGFVRIFHAQHQMRAGAHDAAQHTSETALSIGRQIGSDEVITGAQFSLAQVMFAQGQIDAAVTHAQHALTSYQTRQPVRAKTVQRWLDQIQGQKGFLL